MSEIILSDFLKLVNGETIRLIEEREGRRHVVLQQEYTDKSTIPRKYADRIVTAVATTWYRKSKLDGYRVVPLYIDTILEITFKGREDDGQGISE